MSLLQYTIVNQSAIAKTFTYFSASAYHKINVGGFGTVVFNASSSYTPTQDITGVSEDNFVSDSYIPPSGSAWLWNNGEKVQYIKISDTPLTGSNISSVINKAEWVEFSMIEAIDKNGNYLYPTSPTTAQVERYIINNANDKGAYNSVIINSSSPETSTAVAANTSSAETGFSYIDQQFEVDQDCDPLLNNATEPRINEWLQDVDYSVNAIIPVNFNQLINFTATKAAIPQSNYTQLGFVNSRYAGSSTTRNQINEYNSSSTVDIENKLVYDDEAPSFFINKGKGSSLGKIPNVELNNAYIAYFDRVIDPYPELNNKVAYYVKYLIDESGNILDPNISDINFSIFRDTFQLKDYDNKPTRVNTALSNIEQGKELSQLTQGLNSVYKVGAYPVPILYTQTSSIGHANEIVMSGSKFLTALGPGVNFTDFGANIFATQSIFNTASLQLDTISLPLNNLTYAVTDVSLTNPDNQGRYTTSSISNAPVLFPTESYGKPPNTAGSPLSDNYTLNGSFKFTTSTIPARYSGPGQADYRKRDVYYGSLGDLATKPIYVNLKPYQKPPTSPDNLVNYALNTTNFVVNNIKLTITTRPGEPDQKVWKTLNLVKSPQGYEDQWTIDSTGLVFTPNSLYIEDLILKKLYNEQDVTNSGKRDEARVLIGGGWGYFTDFYGGIVRGIDSIPVKYDWEIDFEQSNFFQGSGFYLKVEGGFNYPQGSGRHGGLFGSKFADDVFLFYAGEFGESAFLQWKRTFSPNYNYNPAVTTPVYSKPILKYFITSPVSSASQVKNTALGPFWRRYPVDPSDPSSSLTPDTLYMSSSILNQTYYDFENKKYFVQAKLPYYGAVNTDFPLTVEPSFIEFDPVTDYWEIKEGDEIRFENNEDLTYTVTAVKGKKVIFPPENPSSNLPIDKLKIIVTPPFEYTASNGQIIKNEPSNFDFFVVRRYKENRNFIILDQQMPYGIISTGKGQIAFSGEDGYVGVEPVNPSSSPGLLLPQYRINKFNTNPDLIIKDLIEKGIVT
jgi:hypothetical protein